MNGDILQFFGRMPEALPLYAVLEEKLLSILPDTEIRITKTQITFVQRRVFACVSFLPVRKAKERPKTYITVTFGLGERKPSPRIDGAVEAYPGRWTHHVLIAQPEQLDAQLLDWLQEAANFSRNKR